MELTQRKVAGYGWRPDLPDARDHHIGPEDLGGVNPLSGPLRTQIPLDVSLRGKMPPVYNQSQLGSCTGNGIAACDEYQLKLEGVNFGTPSRLFIYYGERAIEGTVNEDSGAQIRDGMKVLAKIGAPPETSWPYDIEKFAEKPPAKAFEDAKKHRSLRYKRLPQHLTSFRVCLVNGFPFVFGFTVYESFESPAVGDNGMMPMPQPGESVLGGHCVVGVGFDHQRRLIECRNSWGDAWGDHGHFWMPYEFMLDRSLASDFWTLRYVT